MSDAVVRTFDMGRVVRRTFDAIGANLVSFVLIALVLVALPTVLLAWIRLPQVTDGVVTAAGRTGLLYWLVAAVCWVASIIGYAAIIDGTSAFMKGQSKSAVEMLANVGPRWLTLAGVSIAVGVLVGLGFVLLIVPGIMLAVRWCAALPAQVVEDDSIGASMKRSAELTKGRRWGIFGLLLVYILLDIVVEYGLAALVGGFRGGFAGMVTNRAVLLGIFPLVALVKVPLSGAGIAAIYYELRAEHDGIGADNVAEAFG